MSLAADFESQAPELETVALEVELFAPGAEFAVVVAQFSLQAVQVEQTVETEPAGIGLLCPLMVAEGIASAGIQSELAK